jgi:hypothetical protein
MTFRVEDLTVTLLPERYEIEDAAACTKCTKCTARTGDPSQCSNPSEQGCECCEKNSQAPKPKRTKSSMAEHDLAILRSQLDEFLASLNK